MVTLEVGEKRDACSDNHNNGMDALSKKKKIQGLTYKMQAGPDYDLLEPLGHPLTFSRALG